MLAGKAGVSPVLIDCRGPDGQWRTQGARRLGDFLDSAFLSRRYGLGHRTAQCYAGRDSQARPARFAQADRLGPEDGLVVRLSQLHYVFHE